MSISYVDTTSVLHPTAVGGLVIPRPTVVQGDLLLAMIAFIGQEEFTGLPPGWHALGIGDAGLNLRTGVWMRIANGVEPPGGYAWSWAAFRKAVGVLTAYRGVDPQRLVAQALSREGEAGTLHDTPQVHVPSGGWLVSFVAARHPGTPVRTWTNSVADIERFDAGSDAASGQNITAAAYDSGGAIVAAGDYNRQLTSSDHVPLVRLWSLSLESPTPAGEILPWVVGFPIGQVEEPAPPPPGLGFVSQADAINDVSASTTTTVEVPEGVAVGDWLIAHLAAVFAEPEWDPPDGWNLLDEHMAGNLATAVWTRRITGVEPADYQWGHVSTRTAGRIVAYRGGDATAVVADHAVDGTTSSTTTFGLPEVDVPEDGWLLILTADRRNAPSVPQVWSSSDEDDEKRGEVSGATGSNFQASSAAIDSDRDLPASTPTRTITADETWGQMSVWAIALQPAT